jgi:hypothetical protein
MAAALRTGAVGCVVVVVSPVVGVGVGEGEAEALGAVVADGEGLGEGDVVDDGDALGVGDAVGDAVGDGDTLGVGDGDGDGVGSAAAAGADTATMPTRAITIARLRARMLLLDAKVLPSANHGETGRGDLGQRRTGVVRRGHAHPRSARGVIDRNVDQAAGDLPGRRYGRCDPCRWVGCGAGP